MHKIKRDDEVIVLAGKDKGKRGERELAALLRSHGFDAERGASLDPTAARIFSDGSNEMRALSDQLDQARGPQ